jgi:nicotinate-nucleotide pyrophosphorylase (carboxylating)
MMREATDRLIESAILEDIGDGDHTSRASIPEGATGKARLLIKESGILAGVEMAALIFSRIDNSLTIERFLEDGDSIKPGDIAFTVCGLQHSLLQAERLVLNVMQRMSGISTETRKYCDAVSGFRTRILDTRKTTPGFRIFEKEAVRIGGGVNHRMGLYDMIMLKDNHIDFAGGISNAISGVRDYLARTGRELPVVIEARSIADIETILTTGGVNRIMLDNFSVGLTARAVEYIEGRYETESSGGITLDTVREYAACGVDYISVGALTHQIRSLDMSLKVI